MWAHPRSRGDHRFLHSRTSTPGGSSPLARGPHSRTDSRLYGRGLIPARAGTTCSSRSTYQSPGAHPRSRGDHWYAVGDSFEAAGSSPLARGPQIFVTWPDNVDGLIPARAGTTQHKRPYQYVHGAHPRSRGDHNEIAHHEPKPLGSSPLARGPQSHDRKHY